MKDLAIRKFNLNNWFRIFFYLSLIFVVYALIKNDYLVVPDKISFYYLMYSAILLYAGFLLDSYSWYILLSTSGYNVSLKNSFASSGLSIFGQYIPGKFWTIVGRSGYISKQYGYNGKDIAILSLNAQFLTLWIALPIGSLVFFAIPAHIEWILICFISWSLLSVVLFTRYSHKFVEKTIHKITKNVITIPSLSLQNMSKAIPYAISSRILWSISFYLLVFSFQSQNISIFIGFAFVLSAILGLLVIIAPGGLGIREGFLTLLLIHLGLEEQVAVTVSVFSRIWFFSGELFIFLTGLGSSLLNMISNKREIL